MQLGKFNKSEAYSMGVELELQLIDLNTYDLSSVSPQILKLLGKTDVAEEHFTPEMTESMLEINTRVHTNYDELLAQLKEIRNVLVNTCKDYGVGICGGGTHPFQSWAERTIYNKQRYKDIYKRYGYLAKRFTVFGQHVHIGCTSGDEALFLLHALSRYVPQFIALSASSPYIRGVDTFFDSARSNIVSAFPLSGHAPFILNWEKFGKDYYAKMYKTGTIKSMKDFYWDIRPKPEYGTVELRVCDTPLTVTKAAAIAVYLQVLCKYLLEERVYTPEEDDYLVYNYNRFQASRFGLDGEITHPKTYKKITLREDIINTLNKLEKHVVDLNAMEGIQKIIKYVAVDNDANCLREKYVITNSMEGVVQAAIESFA